MPKEFCLIGYPLSHTMSPPIHKRLFELSKNKNSVYSVKEISPDSLAESVGDLFKLSGFNVTIPHKVSIIEYLDDLDESAKKYGAVNVVKCGEKNIGYNTDVEGFNRSITQMGTNLKGKVMLLGCGGAGRMMAIETALSGGDLTLGVIQSDLERANKVYKDIKNLSPNANVSISLIKDIKGDCDLLINATPVGMFPRVDQCLFGEDFPCNPTYVFDAIYNPGVTKLMRIAASRGAKVQNGMSMLVWQAVAAHEIWYNASYDIADINQLIADMQKQIES